jgi:hypothetical protein
MDWRRPSWSSSALCLYLECLNDTLKLMMVSKLVAFAPALAFSGCLGRWRACGDREKELPRVCGCTSFVC